MKKFRTVIRKPVVLVVSDNPRTYMNSHNNEALLRELGVQVDLTKNHLDIRSWGDKSPKTDWRKSIVENPGLVVGVIFDIQTTDSFNDYQLVLEEGLGAHRGASLVHVTPRAFKHFDETSKGLWKVWPSDRRLTKSNLKQFDKLTVSTQVEVLPREKSRELATR